MKSATLGSLLQTLTRLSAVCVSAAGTVYQAASGEARCSRLTACLACEEGGTDRADFTRCKLLTGGCWLLQREVQKSEESVVQVRQWLDQAQGQLQNTQTALTIKEQECRELRDQLQAQLNSSADLQVNRSDLHNNTLF